MDANNFTDLINELKLTLVAEGLKNTTLLASINKILQYIIENNETDNIEIRSFLLALEPFKNQLPYFTLLEIELINNLFLYNNIMKACIVPSKPQTISELDEKLKPTSSSEEKIFNNLSSQEIKDTAGMYHKNIEIDPNSSSKIITTYRHMEDGTLKEVDKQILTEPNDIDIFANILGDNFVDAEDSKGENLSVNDL